MHYSILCSQILVVWSPPPHSCLSLHTSFPHLPLDHLPSFHWILMISNRIFNVYVNLAEPSLILKILPSLVFDQPTNLNYWESRDHYSHSIHLFANTLDLLWFIPLLFCFTYHQQTPSLKTLALSTSPSFFLSSLITTIGLKLTFSSSFLNLRISLHFSAITLFPTSLEYPTLLIQVSRIILRFTILACCQTYPLSQLWQSLGSLWSSIIHRHITTHILIISPGCQPSWISQNLCFSKELPQFLSAGSPTHPQR